MLHNVTFLVIVACIASCFCSAAEKSDSNPTEKPRSSLAKPSEVKLKDAVMFSAGLTKAEMRLALAEKERILSTLSNNFRLAMLLSGKL